MAQAQSKQTAPASFYWHDYETFGADPMRDRPVQFAGVRTDADLNVIGEPLVAFCKPADDYLPHPQACLVTGITPQQALQEGVCESEFAGLIHAQLSQPGTCTVGYNSLRFDDEVTRFTFYRNFIDPYAREWKNGNSRWDLIDVLRMARTLRPEGINWPTYEDGQPSMRLEDLTTANGLAHANAHDALSDVYATIEMARLLKQAQPKLYEYALSLRDKRRVGSMLDTERYKPVLHISSRFPASQGNAALVAPLAWHPVNRNAVIAYDLRVDPTQMLAMSAEQIRERLYTATEDLPDEEARIPLKLIHTNRCPMLAPANLLTSDNAERLHISGDDCRTHLSILRADTELQDKLRAVYLDPAFEPASDPDLMLYSGGFFNDADRAAMASIRQCPVEALAALRPGFQDGRLEEMLFRFRARNYPQTLTEGEQLTWEGFRRERLLQGSEGDKTGLTFERFYQCLNELGTSPDIKDRELNILHELAAYAESIYPLEEF